MSFATYSSTCCKLQAITEIMNTVLHFVLVLSVLYTASCVSAYAPGDEHTQCTTGAQEKSSYSKEQKIMLDSYNYIYLLNSGYYPEPVWRSSSAVNDTSGVSSNLCLQVLNVRKNII